MLLANQDITALMKCFHWQRFRANRMNWKREGALNLCKRNKRPRTYAEFPPDNPIFLVYRWWGRPLAPTPLLSHCSSLQGKAFPIWLVLQTAGQFADEQFSISPIYLCNWRQNKNMWIMRAWALIQIRQFSLFNFQYGRCRTSECLFTSLYARFRTTKLFLIEISRLTFNRFTEQEYKLRCRG